MAITSIHTNRVSVDDARLIDYASVESKPRYGFDFDAIHLDPVDHIDENLRRNPVKDGAVHRDDRFPVSGFRVFKRKASNPFRPMTAACRCEAIKRIFGLGLVLHMRTDDDQQK